MSRPRCEGAFGGLLDVPRELNKASRLDRDERQSQGAGCSESHWHGLRSETIQQSLLKPFGPPLASLSDRATVFRPLPAERSTKTGWDDLRWSRSCRSWIGCHSLLVSLLQKMERLMKQTIWRVYLPAPRDVPIPNFDIEPMNAVHQADLLFLPHDKVTAALSSWRKSSLVPWCKASYESVSVFILCSWGWGRWALPFPCRLSLQSRIRLILGRDTKITEKPVPWHLFRSLTTESWVLLILFLDYFSPSELRLWSSLCSWSSIFAWSSLSRDDIAHLHARSRWIRFLSFWIRLVIQSFWDEAADLEKLRLVERDRLLMLWNFSLEYLATHRSLTRNKGKQNGWGKEWYSDHPADPTQRRCQTTWWRCVSIGLYPSVLSRNLFVVIDLVLKFLLAITDVLRSEIIRSFSIGREGGAFDGALRSTFSV